MREPRIIIIDELAPFPEGLAEELNRLIAMRKARADETGEPFPGHRGTTALLRAAYDLLAATQGDIDSPYMTQGGNQAMGLVGSALCSLRDEGESGPPDEFFAEQEEHQQVLDELAPSCTCCRKCSTFIPCEDVCEGGACEQHCECEEEASRG